MANYDEVFHAIEHDGSVLLLSIGVYPHVCGFRFLLSAAAYCICDPSLVIKIGKNLYAKVAAACGTTPARVSCGIRHAIEGAFASGKLPNLNNIIGYDYVQDFKPSNSEILSLLRIALAPVAEEKLRAKAL